MKNFDAVAIHQDKLKVEDLDKQLTIGELYQLLGGACLTDDGEIWCIKCNSPNELGDVNVKGEE